MSRLSTTNSNSMKLSNGNTSSIPLRKSLNRSNSNSSTNSANSANNSCTSPVSKIPTVHQNSNGEMQKWRHKYEEAEEKRKSILTEKEKTVRQYNDLQRKHLDLQLKHEQLDQELFERNESLEKLRTISETLFKEYQMLKNQYDTETGAMSRALKDASGWYKENKALKRRTMHLPAEGDTIDESDAPPSTDSDIDNLNKTIKQLSTEIAELQTEVDSLKHLEFQTTEQNIKLAEEADAEKAINGQLRRELGELRQEHDQLKRITDLMTKEVHELQRNDDSQRVTMETLRKEADRFKKERNVLAHQSTLLLQNLEGDELPLLDEIEQLKRAIEDERQRHEEEVRALLEKIEVLENNSQIELLEERLKLAESELEQCRARAEAAEANIQQAVPPPPPPPPPPAMVPPPPPPVPLRVKRRSRANITEIADAIGIPAAETAERKAAPPGVNEDIINAIKQGKFTLKRPKKDKKEVAGGKEQREVTKTVSELLNVLGNLRRTPKRRQSQLIADVEL